MLVVMASVNKALIRANQCGDWLYDEGAILAHSAHFRDRRSEFAVAIHEAVEAWLCLEAGISDEEVTAFDLQFEEERKAGMHREDDENGDDPRAPYHKQHVAATKVEREVVAQLGMTWEEHSDNIEVIYKEG